MPHRNPQPRVTCVLPPHAVRPLPVRRLLASTAVLDTNIDPFESALPPLPDEFIELRCTIEAATALVRQLCAMRHTSARYDTALLTACADVVGALDEALDRAVWST